MTIRRLAVFSATVLLLSGCLSSEKGIYFHNDTDEKVNKAEEIFSKDDRLTGAATVFYEKDLIAAISVGTFSRFNKAKIEEELKKELEKTYPDLEITVSADSKIIMETKKMIESKDKKDIGKKIEKLKTLSKEET